MRIVRRGLAALLLGVIVMTAGRAADTNEASSASTPVLLVCEHGSVKSLIAASLFNRAATERGLPFRAISRGVTPDRAVPPKIAEALEREGFDVKDFKPAPVSSTDIAQASHIVAIGVNLSPVASPPASVEHWNDVPAASVDYSAARLSLKRHVDTLLDELQAGTDWARVDQAIGKKGAAQPGGIYKYGLPRSDLKVTVDGIAIKPTLQGNGERRCLPVWDSAC